MSVLSVGCGAGRKAAATQKAGTFDATKSDPKAVAAVDAMLTALGGAAAWEAVKQIQWNHKYLNGTDVKGWFKHSWDKWNGRHRFEQADMKTLAAAKAANDPKLVKFSIAMYELFDHKGKGYGEYGGRQVSRADRDRFVSSAYTRWLEDHYYLAMHYKVKDPGAKLEHVGELPEKDGHGVCKPKCQTVKVTFLDGVGKDTYYLNINSQTNLLEIVEKQLDKGRIGYVVSDWVTVDGMKFPGRFKNIGVATDIITISGIKVGDADDFLYVPRTRYN